MGISLSSCSNFLDNPCLEDKLPFAPADIAGLKSLHMKLRVDASPIRSSMGTWMHGFRLTDEFEVDSIEMLQGLEPLSWRHQHCARSSYTSWPGGPRTCVAMRYARARIQGVPLLMAVAVAPEHRTMDRVLSDIEDSKDAATYAHSFNTHLQKTSAGDGQDSLADDRDAPRVRVCAPVGCKVLTSAVPQFAHPGAVVTLIPYPAFEVHKFVFDGMDEFSELPQAFFHYVVWMSGGRESLYDVQGLETEDGEFLIVDPVVVRTPKAAVSDIARTLVEGEKKGGPDAGPSQETFEALHPKCGQLCRSFDPMRRGCRARKMCGFDAPTCG